MKRENYIFAGTDLYTVRNRNELRVLKSMAANREIQACSDPDGNRIRDIYAMALNLLPPRYTQSGTIVLREPVRKNVVDEAVREAVQRILNNPKA
ncbi:MAG: late competence development ComFB family protein [Desulfovibrio sp.]|nr:late competence development ComFB family protein [Desulfovibrio sp.]